MNTDDQTPFSPCDTAQPPSLSMADFDGASYRHHLDDLDINETQKAELMRVVWDIMRMWVEMDLPADACGTVIEHLFDPVEGELEQPTKERVTPEGEPA